MRRKECIPRYVSATGSDGAGKDTAWRIAKNVLNKEGYLQDVRIVKIGKPSSVIINGEETFVHMGVSRFLDNLHEVADVKKNRRLTSVVNGMYVMFQWGFQERFLRKLIKPDVVFSLRDGYADPAAYAPFYMSETLGKYDIPRRIEMLHRLHGSPFRDVTFYLDIDPETAVQRIKERIAKQNVSQLVRPKWMHEHENIEGLRQIRNEFGKVLSYLSDEKGTDIRSIDASRKKKKVGEQLAREIKGAVSSIFVVSVI